MTKKVFSMATLQHFTLVLSPFVVKCDLSQVYNISNGKLDNLNTVYEYGDTVDYSCDVGYRKTTTGRLQCLSDKSWSASPICEPGLFYFIPMLCFMHHIMSC